jgi:hypothetical protein
MAENLPQKVEQPKNLPTLQELNYDVEKAFELDRFKSLVYKAPPESWLRKHPTATKKQDGKNVKADYLPIDKVEFLLDRIFQQWKIEILDVGVIFHSVYVTVRVHYVHPVTGEWLFHDGVGAMKAQSDSGAVFSVETIKASAIQIGLPAAKSYAIKDAAEHLGRIFGRDINREAATYEFSGAYSEKPVPTTEEKIELRLIDLIHDCKTVQSLEKLKKDVSTAKQTEAYDNKMKELKNQK